MSQGNRVFDVMRGFRAGAYGLQLWLGGLGLLLTAAAATAAVLGGLPVHFAAGALLMALVSIPWALVWRRRVERAFWQDARVPRRGRPVRLPLAADEEPERP
ncbi:MAG TPA: hypothetical protein PK280_15305 [Planctomycetota bacterium]|nr:hypothetical protein [Planctomycetota bacterium]